MKSQFLSDLETKDIEDNKCVLLADLIYSSELLGQRIVVPRGFVNDKASVPRVPLIYFAFGDRAHREGVLHDYLYQTNMVKKSVADKIFLEAMKSRGKPLWVRWGMFAGVVIGGSAAYRSGPRRLTILGNDKL